MFSRLMTATSRMAAAFRTVRANASSRDRDIDSAELDSHADTCCFGPGAYIVSRTGKSVSVQPFVHGIGTVKDVPIVTAAVAYE